MTQIFNYIFRTFTVQDKSIHAGINLCHSDLFPSQTGPKVIGRHHTCTYMSDASDILSNGHAKDITYRSVPSKTSRRKMDHRQFYFFLEF